MKKVPGVESIKVSLSEGMAHIQLAPGNTVSLEQLRKAVNEQGFTPKEATVVVSGNLVLNGKQTVFKVSGSSDIYEIDPTRAAKMKDKNAVTLKGLVTLPAVNGKPGHFEVKEIVES